MHDAVQNMCFQKPSQGALKHWFCSTLATGEAVCRLQPRQGKPHITHIISIFENPINVILAFKTFKCSLSLIIYRQYSQTLKKTCLLPPCVLMHWDSLVQEGITNAI